MTSDANWGWPGNEPDAEELPATVTPPVSRALLPGGRARGEPGPVGPTPMTRTSGSTAPASHTRRPHARAGGRRLLRGTQKTKTPTTGCRQGPQRSVSAPNAPTPRPPDQTDQSYRINRIDRIDRADFLTRPQPQAAPRGRVRPRAGIVSPATSRHPNRSQPRRREMHHVCPDVGARRRDAGDMTRTRRLSSESSPRTVSSSPPPSTSSKPTSPASSTASSPHVSPAPPSPNRPKQAPDPSSGPSPP